MLTSLLFANAMVKEHSVPGVWLFLKCFCFETVFASIFKIECLERNIVSHAEKLTIFTEMWTAFYLSAKTEYDDENSNKCQHDVKTHCIDFLTEYRRDSRRKSFRNTKKRKQQA